MDMVLALIARLHGKEVAIALANNIELEWHQDSTRDPFAALNGLVPS
jgi:transcriptional regulator GlxA family with amidase domain